MSTQQHSQATGDIASLKARTREASVGDSLMRKALKRLRRDKLTLVALGVVSLLVLLAATAPITTGWLGVSATRTNPPEQFSPPSIGYPNGQERLPDIIAPGSYGALIREAVYIEPIAGPHWLGTDDLGRDHLARLLYAGQISLGIGFSAAVLSILIGVSLGVVTGYYGGIIDDIVIWLVTTLNSIPQLFLLLILSAVLIREDSPLPLFANQPQMSLVLVLGLLGWTGTTRLVRGETLSLREREFIVSARAMGASPWRIMSAHITPNLISIVVVTLAIDIGALILVESALSFLGFGVKPPTPTWGNMLTNAQTFFTKGPYLVIAPGLLISITVLCLYIIGDGVRDAFDPTLKE